MRLAIFQGNPRPCALEHNASMLLQAAKKAADLGASICLAPELFLSAPNPKSVLQQQDFLQCCHETLEKLATTIQSYNNIAVLVGVPAQSITEDSCVKLEPSPPSQAVSTVYLLHKGQAKLQLPAQGKNCVTCASIAGVEFAVVLGEDLWTAEIPPQAQGILHFSALPFAQEREQSNTNQLKASHAPNLNIPKFSANLVGTQENLIFLGQSFAQSNTQIARVQNLEAGLLCVDVDFATNELIHSCFYPTESSHNHLSQLSEEVKSPPNPEDKLAKLWQALVFGTREFVRKSGFDQVVLGLSGGIDSALVACVACEALGADKVTGILMPSPYSSEGSVDHSLALAKNLGITTKTISIAPMMQAFSKSFQGAWNKDLCGTAEENIQARIRGDLIMAYANSFSALALTTGNKSELAVGYCTLYGDMTGALAVIGDLYKTEVFALCAWLNKQENELIPQIIIDKPPSAELRPNQLDADSLPDYALLDDILERVLGQKQSPEQIIAQGYEAELVIQVIKMLYRAEFKRFQAPPVLCVSTSCFGTHISFPLDMLG